MLDAAIDATYAAATGEAGWDVAATQVLRLTGGVTASLMVLDPAGGGAELLWQAVPDEGVVAYRSHFQSMDLHTSRAVRWAKAQPVQAPLRASIGGELLVPDAEFVRSAYYNDFCRIYGLRHFIGTVIPLGDGRMLPIGLQRPAGREPFGERERRLLNGVLPHLRRAAQLRRRLHGTDTGGFDGLAALPIGAMVLTAGGAVRFANAAAERLCQSAGVLTMARNGLHAGICAMPVGAAEAVRFLALVQAAAAGGAGGAMLLAAASGAGSVAALICPLPSRFSALAELGRVKGDALVLLRPIGAAAPPPSIELLRTLFRLTKAEAEVAQALSGGASKASVAAARGLRESTIRTQVRSVLEKTGAQGLRDLERLLAGLQGL